MRLRVVGVIVMAAALAGCQTAGQQSTDSFVAAEMAKRGIKTSPTSKAPEAVTTAPRS